MMDYRENAGYVITDSCHVGESEFVLGVHLTAPQQFVTWKCKDRTDYYWGHYFSSLFDAQKDLVARAHEEVQYLEQRGIDPNKMELEPADSPWGEIQTCHTLCPGAYSVSTAVRSRVKRAVSAICAGILALGKSFILPGSTAERNIRTVSSRRSLTKWSTPCGKRMGCFVAGPA